MGFHCSPEVIIIPTRFFCVFTNATNLRILMKYLYDQVIRGAWVASDAAIWHVESVSSGLYGLLMFALRVCYKECWCTKAVKWCVYFSSSYCQHKFSMFIVKSGLVDSAPTFFFWLFIFCCRISWDCQSCGWCILQHSSCSLQHSNGAFLPSIPKRGLAVDGCILPSVYMLLGLLLGAHPGHAYLAESAFYSTLSSTKSANQRS